MKREDHDYFAVEKMGMHPDISKRVNEYIDGIYGGGHDEGRFDPQTLLEQCELFYKQDGKEGVKAVILHYYLDAFDMGGIYKKGMNRSAPQGVKVKPELVVNYIEKMVIPKGRKLLMKSGGIWRDSVEEVEDFLSRNWWGVAKRADLDPKEHRPSFIDEEKASQGIYTPEEIKELLNV